MKIPALADSHIARSTQRLLEDFGFQVDSVDKRLGSGVPDNLVAQPAQKEDRILISGDKVFANARQYPSKEYNGVIVVRVKPLTAERMNRALRRFLSETNLRNYQRVLVVVTATNARIIR